MSQNSLLYNYHPQEYSWCGNLFHIQFYTFSERVLCHWSLKLFSCFLLRRLYTIAIRIIWFHFHQIKKWPVIRTNFTIKNFSLFTFDCCNFSSTTCLPLSLFEKTAWKSKRHLIKQLSSMLYILLFLLFRQT